MSNTLLRQVCIAFLSFFLMISTASASYNKSLWNIWLVHDPLSYAEIPHDDWQAFLDKCVIKNAEGINLVDYAGLTTADKLLLNRYINTMSHIKIENYNRKEQLAFWINLYNALIVQIVSNYYPISTIEEINTSPGLFSIGPWGAKLVTVNNIELSLDEIQNRIIRPIWNDPRTLYAVNNGAIGSANLNKKAFHGANIEAQLDYTAASYVNSLRGVQVIEGEIVVSKIYDWYNDDFGGNKQDIIFHLKQFAHEPLKSQLKHINSVESYVYNWHLNSTILPDRE